MSEPRTAAEALLAEGGSVYGLLAGKKCREAIRFIVAYQTICDYLDNLCDRSTSLDPSDFRALHESLFHALTPTAGNTNYYRFRHEQDDGGYLASLVKTCQEILEQLSSYKNISSELYELAGYYRDLQIHKHVKVEDRVPRLQEWFKANRDGLPEMSWYEFSACCGSTLGIFCLVACSFHDRCSDELGPLIKDAYFPWVQGLHILLDYFIDQEEDRQGGDLNFTFYYASQQEMMERLKVFIREAHKNALQCRQGDFAKTVVEGLLAMYLSDKKVKKLGFKSMASELLRESGNGARHTFHICSAVRKFL